MLHDTRQVHPGSRTHFSDPLPRPAIANIVGDEEHHQRGWGLSFDSCLKIGTRSSFVAEGTITRATPSSRAFTLDVHGWVCTISGWYFPTLVQQCSRGVRRGCHGTCDVQYRTRRQNARSEHTPLLL